MGTPKENACAGWGSEIATLVRNSIRQPIQDALNSEGVNYNQDIKIIFPSSNKATVEITAHSKAGGAQAVRKVLNDGKKEIAQTIFRQLQTIDNIERYLEASAVD